MSDEKTIEQVRSQYADVAKSTLGNDSETVRAVASAFGYSEEELNQLPQQANMGLSCGNPLALAGIKPGEIVLDLGCGGGMDLFLAAKQVGPSGKAIGVDMTSEMLTRAEAGRSQLGLENVELHQASIDHVPLADETVDCVISNCVINLAPDKLAVFREIRRVLKPGGRVAISDIALKQALPVEVKASVEAYVGCISGALLFSEYRELLKQAGFSSIVLTDTGADLNAYAQASGGCCGTEPASSSGTPVAANSSLHDGLAQIMHTFDANAYVASVRVHAMSPPYDALSQQSLTNTAKEKNMKTIQVYDKPMCCSTGVCGPEVDPVLPQFAADLDWLKGQGHQVERFNLAQQPQAFIDNATIHQLLSSEGVDCLPVILVNGEVVSRKSYPTREALAASVDGSPVRHTLPLAEPQDGCCGSSGCC